MPYIRIVFKGHKTFGGYLTIDGKKYEERKLSNNEIIEVASGFHQLRLTSMSYTDIERSKMRIDNPNITFDTSLREYGKLTRMMDCSINHEFKHEDEMVISIMSGINGEILETPEYVVNQLSDEKIKEMDRIATEKRLEAQALANKEYNRPVNKIKRFFSALKKIVLWGIFAVLVVWIVVAIFAGEKFSDILILAVPAVVLFFVALNSMDD